MAFPNLRRLIVGMAMIGMVAVLGLFVDAAFSPLYEEVMARPGFADSPWSAPVEVLPEVAVLIVGILIVGVFMWMLVGPIQETQVEVRQRRIR